MTHPKSWYNPICFLENIAWYSEIEIVIRKVKRTFQLRWHSEVKSRRLAIFYPLDDIAELLFRILVISTTTKVWCIRHRNLTNTFIFSFKIFTNLLSKMSVLLFLWLENFLRTNIFHKNISTVFPKYLSVYILSHLYIKNNGLPTVSMTSLYINVFNHLHTLFVSKI